MPAGLRIALRTLALCGLALAALPDARAAAAGDATSAAILNAIDRVPEGTTEGNPRVWQGAFARDAEILTGVAPFRFSAPAQDGIFSAFSADSLTRAGVPLFQTRAHDAAYDVVRLREIAPRTGTADAVFVTTAAPGEPGYSISAYAFVPASGPGATGARADVELIAPVRALAAAMSADAPPTTAARAAIVRAYAPSPAIVTDVAPYRFAGPKAVASWTAAFERSFAAGRIRDVRVTLGRPEFVHRAGTRATFVVAAHVAFTAAGQAQSADGRWLFVVERGAGRYRILASAWAQLATS
jgi:hypothetical protein